MEDEGSTVKKDNRIYIIGCFAFFFFSQTFYEKKIFNRRSFFYSFRSPFLRVFRGQELISIKKKMIKKNHEKKNIGTLHDTSTANIRYLFFIPQKLVE